MNKIHAVGFEPVYGRESVALILGSFPSVMSRAVNFYYGNPQNKFWRTVCSFFGEETPVEIAAKQKFLMRHKIALWDVVTECEIVGSSDSSIRNVHVADIPRLMAETAVKRIYCNGRKAFELLLKHYPQYEEIATLLPSTSPANGRFTAEPWQKALEEIAALSGGEGQL